MEKALKTRIYWVGAGIPVAVMIVGLVLEVWLGQWNDFLVMTYLFLVLTLPIFIGIIQFFYYLSKVKSKIELGMKVLGSIVLGYFLPIFIAFSFTASTFGKASSW